jgi:hypothetical protein
MSEGSVTMATDELNIKDLLTLADHGWLLRHKPSRRHGGICR